MKLSLRTSAAAALSIGLLLASAPAAAAPVSIRAFAAQQVRLATIAYRISTASAELCRPAALTGIITHDLTEYDRSLRPAVSRAFSLTSGIGVVGIVPESAAARAGLQIDDEIVRVGDVSVEDESAFGVAAKSYNRHKAFAALLAGARPSGAVQLLVRRNGQLRSVEITPEAGCGGDVALANSSQLNAWSDGAHVVVTTAMNRLARSDDEIAFVIAHEMAHNILGHSQGAGQRRGIFGGIAKARRDETDADSFAVGLMSRGGYQPEGGITFLRTVGRRLWWALSLDHPTFDRRVRTVSTAIAELPARNARYAIAASVPPAPERLAQSVGIAKELAQPSVTLASYAPGSQPYVFRFPGLRNGRSCAY
jgi:Zn-dependent protease with chaperone function